MEDLIFCFIIIYVIGFAACCATYSHTPEMPLTKRILFTLFWPTVVLSTFLKFIINSILKIIKTITKEIQTGTWWDKKDWIQKVTKEE